MRPAALTCSCLAAALVAAGLTAGVTAVARADTISIGYSVDGGTTKTAIGSPSSTGFIGAPSPYVIDVKGVPSFKLKSFAASGTASGTDSIFGNYPEPKITSDTMDASSTSGGHLILYVTEQGLTTAVPANTLKSTFTSNTLDAATATLSDYVDYDNGRFTTPSSALSSYAFAGADTPPPQFASITPRATPYSITMVYDIAFTGIGDTNLTISTARGNRATAPEPGSLALLAIGLLGLGLIRRRPKA